MSSTAARLRVSMVHTSLFACLWGLTFRDTCHVSVGVFVVDVITFGAKLLGRLRLRLRLMRVIQHHNKSTMAAKLTPSPTILRALPLLKKEFAKQSKDGTFPIFSEKQLDQAWKYFSTPVPPPANEGAAILVPVCSYENKPSILFTKRASHLSSHSSEISFPGGHVEESDSSLRHTALRETQEEIATPLDNVYILGEGTAVPSIKGVPVTPIIAVLPHEIDESMLTGDPSEVDLVFCRSIESLLEEETSKHLSRLGRPAPVYPSPYGDIWGLTAFVLRPIMRNLLRPVFEEIEQLDDDNRISSL